MMPLVRATLALMLTLPAATAALFAQPQPQPQPAVPAGVAPVTSTGSWPTAPATPATPLAGASYDDDARLPAHARAVADYTLRATLDPVTHTVHGEGTLTWRNASARPVRELWVHLYLNAFKNERSAFLRERVGGRGSSAPEDWGWIDVRRFSLRRPDAPAVDLWPAAELHRAGDDDETDVRVPLPEEVAPGERISIDVAFDDKLPVVVERTGYRGTFHMVGQWFPKIARLEPDGTFAHFPFHHLAEFYADFGDYDVTIDVPEAYTIGATGPVVESRVDDGRRIERHAQADVHDFAWTAWDRWQVARERIDGVDVALLYPPGFARLAERELAALRFALPYYGEHFGRYPYPGLTVVHPQDDASEAGGMEYPTLITSGGAWWTPDAVLSPEIVTVHELGHQWFYGLVATNELAWPFLDEGLNQFAEEHAMGAWRGSASASGLAGLALSDGALDAVGGNMGVHDEPVAQAANAFTSGANYADLVYARTATVMETFARVYGEDAVLRALGRYARRFRFEHPGPDDFLATVREVLGAQPAATLRAALFDKGWVDYVIDGVWSQRARRAGGVFDRDGKRDKVEPGEGDSGEWENAVTVRRRGTLSFPVDIELVMADGSTRRERWDGEGASRHIAWRGAVRLRGAVVDPDDRVMIDANLANNRGSAAAAGGGGGAPRTLERATYWMQLAVQAVAP
jgi:hypothetical protein